LRSSVSRLTSRTLRDQARCVLAGGSGLGELTERELEVARLVADRRTNPEISATLYLSQKTVETHLRNIFNKIGVDNRVALAREVERASRSIAHADE
jgi:DNA-binding CsgD family transcriptional regulator